MNRTTAEKSLDWKKIFLVLLIAAILGYQWYQQKQPPPPMADRGQQVAERGSEQVAEPTSESERKPNPSGKTISPSQPPQAGENLSRSSESERKPNPSGKTINPSQSPQAGENLSRSPARDREDFLKPVGGRNLASPAGLIYTMGPGGEHRVDHVMRHALDDEDRDVHGVFDGDKEDILRLIDEAYELVKSGSKRVTTDDSRDNVVHTVAMQRRIGYEGGVRGKRSGNRPLTRLRLVLREDRVITAYPYR